MRQYAGGTMPAEQLYNVIFEGKPVNNYPKQKAVNSLAKLTKRQPQQIAGLFNAQPTLLKRNVPGETAKKYLQILRSNGLACHIEEGVHLQAVEEKTKTAPPQPEAVTQPPEPDVTTPPVKPPLTQDTTKNNAIFNFHYPDHGGLIKLLTLSFLLPDGIELDTTPDKMPPASIGQQILAAIDSTSNCGHCSRSYHFIF
jgi:hypothetical protein